VKRLSHNTGMQIIALIAIVFAVAQWGSQNVRFGVALALVALIAFLAGRRERRRRRSSRVEIATDFLACWSYCPVSDVDKPSSPPLRDAARQLVEALDA
jgi:hypothetical protein